jgi:hypothetical protein
MEPYQHFPLRAPNSIRIIELEPSEDPSCEIRCRIVQVSLGSHPSYAALSYSWDARTPSNAILCRSTESGSSSYAILHATYNCLSAMRQLRLPRETRRLWIDSICIDQSSIDEKSQQVPLMGEIYKVADEVVLWLGEKDEAATKAFEFIDGLQSYFSNADMLGSGEGEVRRYLLSLYQGRLYEHIPLPNPA